MKKSLRNSLLAAAFLSAGLPLWAAAPVTTSLTAPGQGVVGTPILVAAAAEDADSNLQSMGLSYRDLAVPGTWHSLASQSVSGGYGEAVWSWTPTSTGNYEFRSSASDGSSSSSYLYEQVEIVDDAPVPELLEFPSVVMQGETIRITGSGSDADGNLKEMAIYYDPPSAGFTWIQIGGWIPVSNGFYDSVAVDWTPQETGDFRLHLGVRDWDSQTHDSHEAGSIYIVESVPSGSPVPPIVADFSSPASGVVGEAVYMSARVTDANGNLSHVRFYYDLPSSGTQWLPVGMDTPVSGPDDTAGIIWTPTTAGTNRVHVGVYDGSGLSHEDSSSWFVNQIEIAASATPPAEDPVDPLIVQGPLAIGTGIEYNEVHEADIATSGAVTVQNAGNSIFWSGGTITLGQGFTASPGTGGSFLAVIDSDMDGRTDTVENVDSDGDGMLDGYEYEIIDFSLFDTVDDLSDVTGGGDFDGDGITNATEIANGTSPAGLDPGQSSAYGDLLVLPIPESSSSSDIVETDTLLTQ